MFDLLRPAAPPPTSPPPGAMRPAGALASLRSIELTDRAAIEPFFASLARPLSDYSFSQLFTWRNSLRLLWTTCHGHLCVFANGTGDLTLLMPPIGGEGGNMNAALREAFERLDDYNASHHVTDPWTASRVEYISEEVLGRIDRAGLIVEPMGGDYLYDTQRMIDLAGGDLKSKRQEKNRFERTFAHRCEPYDAGKHLEPCLQLLQSWQARQDEKHSAAEAADRSALKRQKESLATELTLRHADALGLRGLIVQVTDESDGGERLAGFTLGEPLAGGQASIVVEKTDLACRGLAQFIFSAFCRTAWADRPLVNAGDDWGLPSLAWTKQSYRPVDRLAKYTLRRVPVAQAAVPIELSRAATEAVTPRSVIEAAKPPAPADAIRIRRATLADVHAATQLENRCFDHYRLGRRQLTSFLHRPTAVFLVAEDDPGNIAGDAVGLLRHHTRGLSGRFYSLAVDPAHRGRGMGEQLARALLAELVRQGAARIYLEVAQSNVAAVALYAKLGFQQIDVLPDYYGPGQHAVHMLREEATPLSKRHAA